MDAASMSERSRKLSDAMLKVGFKSSNAAMQSGVAMVAEELFNNVILKDKFGKGFLFGSFADGWGSCLNRTDGSIDSTSDMDLSLMLHIRPIHIANQLRGCGCSELNKNVEYNDGHVNFSMFWNIGSPCVTYKGKNDFVPNIDFLFSVPCCNYPDIEILKPGYKTHIARHILDALKQEVLSPRCHAVTAAPPGQHVEHQMRVSTTLLERIVMRNLTTIQGQFFILLKYIIKKVVNAKGLKTYVVKNLLFYMLDETPADEWRSDNLLALVEQALQKLIVMMESEEAASGSKSCMKHFFLRDANVYLKEESDSKSDILNVVRDVCQKPYQHVQHFAGNTLAPTFANVVNFDVIVYLLMFIYLVENEFSLTEEMLLDGYAVMSEICRNRETPPQADSLNQLLDKINEIQNLPDFLKECMRIMASHNIGAPADSTDEELYGKTFGGVSCPTGDTEITVESAKCIILKVLKNNPVLGIIVSNGAVENISVSGGLMATIFRDLLNYYLMVQI